MALESKSKILVAQQNKSVSGAILALSDLSSRLNDLVEQLVASYNISEQELEVSEICILMILHYYDIKFCYGN